MKRAEVRRREGAKARRCQSTKVPKCQSVRSEGRRLKVDFATLLLCYLATFYLHTVLLTLTAFSFPAFEGVVEEGVHAAGLGGWRMPEVGRFVVGGVGRAAFEDTMEGEVKEGPVCGGFHIWVLAEIPIVVEKATAAVHAKDAQCCGQAVNFQGGAPCFVPDKAEGSAKLPCEARNHGIHAGLDRGKAAVVLSFDFEESFAEKSDFLKALGEVGGERFALGGE